MVSGPFPIKLGGVCQTSLVTNITFLISLVNGCHVTPTLTRGIMRDADTFSIRSAPETDVFEAAVCGGQDAVSQSV